MKTSKMICESIQRSGLGDSKITLAVGEEGWLLLAITPRSVIVKPTGWQHRRFDMLTSILQKSRKSAVFSDSRQKRTEWKKEKRVGVESFSCKQELNTIMLALKQRALISSTLA
ncbi:MAG: hypothetical protein ACK5NI_02270, partial [bacterium]